MQFYVEGYYSYHNIPEQQMDIYPHVKLVTDDFEDYIIKEKKMRVINL